MWPLGKARPWPIVRATSGFPNVVARPVTPGPATASTAARGHRRSRQTSATAAASPATTAGDPKTMTVRANP